MNADELLFHVLEYCAPSQSIAFYYVVEGNFVGFSVSFYNYENRRMTADGMLDFVDGVLYPQFQSRVKEIDVKRDDAPALLARCIDSFISARDAYTLSVNHNRKVQP